MRTVWSQLDALWEWVDMHQDALSWVAAFSALTFVGSLLVMPVLLTRLRADYFVRPVPDEDTWLGRQPAARVVARGLKNGLGAILFLAGLVMMVLPGQGVITLIVALSLLEFPGKRRLELRLVQQPRVRRAVTWIRARAGRPPLQLPDTIRPGDSLESPPAS